jgi:hypothetical protein
MSTAVPEERVIAKPLWMKKKSPMETLARLTSTARSTWLDRLTSRRWALPRTSAAA